MTNTLLLIGGMAQAALGLFHLVMNYSIYTAESIAADVRTTMLEMNIGLTGVLFFFAYASFFQRETLLSTRLGNALLVLISLFYFARAVEEIVFRKDSGFSAIIFVLCTLVGVVYAGALT